ncbi:hypothetical protein BASA81_008079 [Batrachochytrium salamandrivorans]|nr:hypothetical protein BASA81_008079 [Batrachochytrium salamandrivorans]
MAEKYREMGKAGDGMKTGLGALEEVAPVWEMLRSDSYADNYVWCKFDKTKYMVVAQGDGGLEEMSMKAAEDSSFVYFGGVRVQVQGKARFVHIVYIPSQASALQKGKAQLHKSAVFNAWPGSSAEKI